MKLARVFFLFILSSAVLFIGAVDNALSRNRIIDGSYICDASARRFNTANVDVKIIAECTSNLTKDGGFYLYLYRDEDLDRLAVNWQPYNSRSHLDEPFFGLIDGKFKAELSDRIYSTEYGYAADGYSFGKDYYGTDYEAWDRAEVGEIPLIEPTDPEPTDPEPTPGDDDPCDEVGLFSVNGSYTATPGESHESCVTTDAPYSEIYWYVAPPGEAGLGTYYEIDTGDGSTTEARFSYTFPSGAMHTGTYKITAYIYRSDLSVYWEEYTVDVSVD